MDTINDGFYHKLKYCILDQPQVLRGERWALKLHQLRSTAPLREVFHDVRNSLSDLGLCICVFVRSWSQVRP